MATMSKRCRNYSISVRPKCAPFFAVNCHLVGLQSYTSSSWPPVCRWVSALGQSRTMRQQAETVRGPYWQPMWARKDVCGLFAANVGPSAANVGPRRHVLAANVGSIAACLWARGITFVGRYSYVAKYVVSPPIAVRRIDRYDGHRVTYHYRSHRTERVEHATVDVDTFIGRMVQHTMPKGFKRIRYYGVQATKTFAKVKVVIQAALAKVEGVVKGAVKIIARLTYRQRYEKSTGRDPLRCPHCRGEMGLWRIWHPTYGVIYDEVQVIKRGTYESTAQRAGP